MRVAHTGAQQQNPWLSLNRRIAMTTLDFTPLFQSTIGFDRLPDLLAHALTRDESGYPPYNIEKTGENSYRIVMALAGFSRDDIEIISERNQLSVRGAIRGKNENTYLHQGIAQRSFQRVLDLADYIVVTGASMNDGLLVIDLKRELPEALKPRRIEINGSNVTPFEQKSLGDQAA
jgi:molecular chaperone IbpA